MSQLTEIVTGLTTGNHQVKRQASKHPDFEDFFRNEYLTIVNMVFLVVGEFEEARDIAQEAFLKLFQNWDKVRTYERPRAWVRRVALRDGLRWFRSRSLFSRTLSLLSASGQGAAPPNLELKEALRALPTNQRIAIVMHYYEKAPAHEISEVLGCGEATARVHLHRAKKKLAQALGLEE